MVSCRATIVERGRILRGSEPAEHQMQATNPNHRFARIGAPLVIAAVSPIPPVPRERSLHHPALWQHRESLDARLSCFDFEFPTRSMQRQPLPKAEVVVLVVSPEFLQARVIL